MDEVEVVLSVMGTHGVFFFRFVLNVVKMDIT